MTEETAGIERLDYSKPPPGYTADGQWWSHPPDEPSKVVFLGGYVDARNVARVAPDDGALAAAWAHYKASNDPVLGGHAGGWAFDFLDGDARGSFTLHTGARAAAWAWYDRRLALAEKLDVRVAGCVERSRVALNGLRALQPADETVARFEVEHGAPAFVDMFNLWPRCLTWSDEQVNEVERWLVDSTAEMPEVLRG